MNALRREYLQPDICNNVLYLENHETGSNVIRPSLEFWNREKALNHASFVSFNEKMFNAKEQLEHLKNNACFNVSQLAIMLKVQRPAIYEWLEGKENLRQNNQKRLDEIFGLFKDWKDLKIGSYFYKKINEEKSLYDFLNEENINLELTNKYVADIRLALIRNKENADKKQKTLEQAGFEPLSHKELSKRADLFLRKIS